ncbi:MAG TPA: hypothetical protein VFF36_17030, partial [Planctomycetota bacterium]|nr:hypothetical protein [Planctomycetota bacterium]
GKIARLPNLARLHELEPRTSQPEAVEDALVEQAYGVKVPDKDLSLATFDSIDKIAAYVAARR